MRASIRLLADVRTASSRFLRPGAPTGLTGLKTHPAPRSTLIYLYSSTLDKLKAIPESSAYRQATEALTKHRLQIVESSKPEGYDAWQERIKKLVAEHADKFPSKGNLSYGDRQFILTQMTEPEHDEREIEWDGEELVQAPEGTRHEDEQRNFSDALGEGGMTEETRNQMNSVKLEPEPALTVEQISRLETEIGAGLIEEVIEVAEGELKLVNEMVKNQVWEDLAEQAPEGQWTYFERQTHSTKS